MCIGTRILSSIAKECGCNTSLIFVKKESYVPIFTNKSQYQSYQFIFNGLIWGSCYAASKITNKEEELLFKKLSEIKPAAICLSTRTFAKDICKDLFPKIKQKVGDVPIFSGGWGPSLEPEEFLQFSDYVTFGEGEKVIKKICHALQSGQGINEIPNLIFYKNSRIQRNNVIKPLSIQEINELPFPDYSIDNSFLIHKNKIYKGQEFFDHKVYDIFAARGCPLNCSYCLSSKYSKLYKDASGTSCPKYRLKSFDVFLNELRYAKNAGAKYIRIKDEIFPMSKSWIDKFLEIYPKEINLPFFAYVRPEFHSPEILKKMSKSGLRITVVGIQSGSEEILHDIYLRDLDKKDAIDFARTLKANNISFFYHFIYNNPFEREEHLKESLFYTYELPYGQSMIFRLEPHPSTPIANMIKEKNPTPIDSTISEWYSMLHALSLNGKLTRHISKVLYKYKIFRNTPKLLAFLFAPLLFIDSIQFLYKKIKLGAHSINVKAN